jgi:hypothetical protein
MAHDFQADIDSVTRIDAVPTILDVVCHTTGMRFAAVARVTEDRWIACSVLDEIDFGLKQGESVVYKFVQLDLAGVAWCRLISSREYMRSSNLVAVLSLSLPF